MNCCQGFTATLSIQPTRIMHSRMKDRPSDGPDRKAIGERLRLTREAMRLQQNEFAERAGIAPTTYNQWEKGKNEPDVGYAIALCDAHHLTLDWIYRGDASGLKYELAELIKRLRAVST